MALYLLLVAVCILIYLSYQKLNRIYSYWERKGIKGPKPQLFLGNFGTVLTRKDSPTSLVCKLYTQYPDERFVGFYQGLTPVLLIRDPELITMVLKTNFTSFMNRGIEITKEPFCENLFLLKGDQWRSLRYLFSPQFTTKKFKQMMLRFNMCASQYVDYLNKLVDNPIPQEIRKLNKTYGMKCATSIFCGIDVDTFTGDCNNKYVEIADLLIDPNHVALAALLNNIVPESAGKLGIKVLPKKASEFFSNLLYQLMKGRSANVDSSFRDLLIAIRNQEVLTKKTNIGEIAEVEITDAVLQSSLILLFFTTYSTAIGTMSFLLHELAINPDVQERCYEEVLETMARHGGELPYEALSEMQYLSLTLDETLRKYSAGVLTRESTTEYTFPGTSLTIHKGTKIIIAMQSIQNDPKYFDDPERFQPERFVSKCLGDNCGNTYLPFGDGPRQCIGMRFARIQILVGLAYILQHFRLETCEKTVPRVRYDPRPYLDVVSIDGLWVNIARRQ